VPRRTAVEVSVATFIPVGAPLDPAKLAPVRVLTGLRRAHLGLFTGDEHLEPFTSLPALEELLLVQTCVTDAGLERACRLPRLRKLSLVACSQVTDEGMKHLGKLKRLEVLSIRYAREVRDAGAAALTGATGLRELELFSTSVTDRGADALAKLPALEVLDLSLSEVTDRALVALARAPRLRTLSVYLTQVTNTGVATFRRARPDVEVLHDTE
jgi:hypothetical protein